MIGKTIRKVRDISWLAHALAFLGIVLYFVQSWTYAHIQTSLADEGGYLYIGDLYLRGVLRPFQDYGPPRWYAPLSYLVPGQIEKWFGASLLTGRYFSVFCGICIAHPIVADCAAFRWKMVGCGNYLVHCAHPNFHSDLQSGYLAGIRRMFTGMVAVFCAG